MSALEFVKWTHLLAAAVWTGGLITLAVLVTAIRRTTDDVEILRAVARRFSGLSWLAFGVAIITGTWMYTDIGLPWEQFSTKGTLIVAAGGLALFHQLTAKRSSAVMRGVIQLLILIVSIGIFGAAVVLV